MQMLFQMDMGKQTPDQVRITFWKAADEVDGEVRGFAEDLFRVAVGNLEKIDELITANSKHWRIERMPSVDRNILRLAVYEMMYSNTPAAVVIDEALELARRYSNEESVQFVNGVLDAVHRDLASAKAPSAT